MTTANNDAEKIGELSAIIQAVRDRVRARYPQPGHLDSHGIPVRVADLMPLVHARDAAQAKIAAIGSVNPRAGGLANTVIQSVKKTIARSLQWFVRDQVTFNREIVSAIEAVMEALNDHNREMVALGERILDLGQHWNQWRADWERKLSENEITFLRNNADLQATFQHRLTVMESRFADTGKAQHESFLGALDRAGNEIQKKLWADMARIRTEYERLIHDELRIIRMRAVTQQATREVTQPAAAQPVTTTHVSGPPEIDYTRFSARFRGSEEAIRKNQEIYKPYFAGLTNVLDIGCGRGEFLELMRELNVNARGIDLGEESVAFCKSKGLNAEIADLFPYLSALPDGEFDGIFSSQVVEHIEPAQLPEMIRLCAAKLRRGGLLAIETPNPECLAIFASYFYLDPTHTRPVPHPLIDFYMGESGLGGSVLHKLSPALEQWPSLGELPKEFREQFFGGMDYAILGRKL
jgi:2-polyprenyl-3-methyl-5-hydroxy-6-metoxy-1,4-benzoquinol methylase